MSGAKDQVAREAVETVRLALIRELEFYPREPTAPDYGIDLFAECAVDNMPNGRMLGIQVKGGTSWFNERAASGAVVFRGNARHLEYWLGHSLPVIVVLYNPADSTSIWQHVSPTTIESTGEGWKVEIPLDQRLNADSAPCLLKLAEADLFTVKLNDLRSDLSWMRLLRDGGDMYMEVEEWVNKTSGRGTVSLVAQPKGGGEDLVGQRDVFFGLTPYAEILPRLLPWAQLDVDELLSEEHESATHALEEGHYDKEEGRTIIFGAALEEWRENRGLVGLRPYEDTGEVARWRLTLTLNELGRSVVVLDDYLAGD